MSFNQNTQGRGYAPGWFLAEADCSRETVTVSANHAQAVTIGTSKIVPAGAVIPANGSTAIGILYEDVEVTTGDMPGSIVTRGVIYGDRLPAALDSDAATALTGIVVKTVPDVVRPDTPLKEIGIESTEGTAAGDTALTVDYTPGTGESYKYKVGDAAVPVEIMEPISAGWTSWDGSSDITAATNKILTLVSIKGGKAVAYGTVKVTAKA